MLSRTTHAADADVAVAGLVVPAVVPAGTGTILIVDDIESNRSFLVTILRHHGHRVLEAANGREGLTIAKAELPDLIITDVLMPVMDGYELVRQLRLEPTTKSIPVVFYTAHYGEREARALALSSGVSHVLTKPVDSRQVLEVVSRMLSLKRPPGLLPDVSPTSTDFDRRHVRLLTDKLSEKVGDLITANARLRALINIGVELASEEDPERRLQRVCGSARDFFDATYVVIGLLHPDTRRVQRLTICGAEASAWIGNGDSVPGILGRAVAERRTFRGNNPGGDPSRLGLPSTHPSIQAFLAGPIASAAHVYGWICLVGNEGTTFTEDDEHLLMVMSGQVGRIHELEHEILEREQAQSALREERDRAERYLHAAEVILAAVDLEGRITLINRKGCEILGWTSDELLGRNWIEVCVPARMQVSVGADLANLLAGDVAVVVNPVITKSGDERLIEWRNTLLRDDAGRVAGVFTSGTDITDRTEAAEALRIAEERMRFALETAGVGIWDADFTAGTLKWSAILESQYGLSPGSFRGTFESFIECVHPDDTHALLQTLARANLSGAQFTTKHRAIWPDGTARWLAGSGRIYLGDRGEPMRGIGISMDITERHTLEEQYQQAQKMDAIGQLAGGVAHDFNNLLTAILGYCELLLTDFDRNDPRREDIAEIQRAGLSAAALTRQLLAFSRKQIIEPVVLDLNVVVEGMQAMLGRLIGDDVKVLLNLRPRLGCIKADRGQVEQIVLNLAVNARDAMPKGGTLTIETATIDRVARDTRSSPAAQSGSAVVLTVSDTGTGMTPEVLSRLFEPFFTTKELGKGTGLGLATVQGIATGNGGSVKVRSELGRGSSFEVYFPKFDDADAVIEAPVPVARPRSGSETVLVVDDAEGLRELTRRLLERQGYTVLVASNADEALRAFDGDASIDVLLTDVVMPGASGPELTTRLVKSRPELKVIYMSGYTEDAIVHHGVLNPGIAFLNKPFTAEILGRKLREVLDR